MRSTTLPAAANIRSLRQTIDVLRRIDDRHFGATSPLTPGATVGRHLRHCLDAYVSFLDGLRDGRIDYGRRARETALETSRERAITRAAGLAERLEWIADSDADRPLQVRPEDAPEGAWSRSTARRELQYLLSHSIHHEALMAVMLRAFGVEPPRAFGVAPSTLRHWAAAARRAG